MSDVGMRISTINDDIMNYDTSISEIERVVVELQLKTFVDGEFTIDQYKRYIKLRTMSKGVQK